MLPAERLGRILGALLGEGRPRTIRGAACIETAGRRPTADVGIYVGIYVDVSGIIRSRVGPGADAAPTAVRSAWPRSLSAVLG